jgi:hypothetical protein
MERAARGAGQLTGTTSREERENGRRTGGRSLWSAGRTRTRPGTARRSRKLWIFPRTPCRVAAQQRTRRPESSGFSPRSKSIPPLARPRWKTYWTSREPSRDEVATRALTLAQRPDGHDHHH